MIRIVEYRNYNFYTLYSPSILRVAIALDFFVSIFLLHQHRPTKIILHLSFLAADLEWKSKNDGLDQECNVKKKHDAAKYFRQFPALTVDGSNY